MADGRLLPIESLQPGDVVASVHVPGLEVDVPYRAQYQWLTAAEHAGATPRPGRVASVRLGEHEGFVVINQRIKATPEHPLLVRRGDRWGFASAELVQPGDRLLAEGLAEELVESVIRIDARVRTVAVYVPGTNTFAADGVWVHNDMPVSATSDSSSGKSTGSESSSSGSSSSGSGGKSSGSSFTTSSSSGTPTSATSLPTSLTDLTFGTALTNTASSTSSSSGV